MYVTLFYSNDVYTSRQSRTNSAALSRHYWTTATEYLVSFPISTLLESSMISMKIYFDDLIDNKIVASLSQIQRDYFEIW